jgi:hypothetical protein
VARLTALRLRPIAQLEKWKQKPLQVKTRKKIATKKSFYFSSKPASDERENKQPLSPLVCGSFTPGVYRDLVS